MPFSAPVLTYRAKGLVSNIQSKVLKVHNTLININITAILAPEMTYTPIFFPILKKIFITNFVTCVTNFVTRISKFVTSVTKFVIKIISADNKNFQGGRKNFQGERKKLLGATKTHKEDKSVD